MHRSRQGWFSESGERTSIVVEQIAAVGQGKFKDDVGGALADQSHGHAARRKSPEVFCLAGALVAEAPLFVEQSEELLVLVGNPG